MNKKLARLMETLPDGLDAALIEDPVNRRYYTCFSSSAGSLLVFRDEAFFFIDSRYFEAAQAAIMGCTVILQEKLHEQIAQCLSQKGAKSMGVLSDKVTVSQLARMAEKFPDIELVADNALSALVNSQRRIKDDQEIASIRRAQKIAEKSFLRILDYIKPGRTEREIALELEFFSRRAGSEEAAFSFIVVSGPNSSRPHGVPTNRAVQKGDFITIDFGATSDGYRSDMTRTVAVGEVSQKQYFVYNTVLRAQNAALKAIRSGVPCAEVDQAARDLIAREGFGEYFGHSLGHSLGLEIHESPNFAPNSEDTVQSGTIMSVEPGIYLPGEFGVRIEDIVVVTDTGYNNLTGIQKELFIL